MEHIFKFLPLGQGQQQTFHTEILYIKREIERSWTSLVEKHRMNFDYYTMYSLTRSLT